MPLQNYSANQFLRLTSRREQGERGWHSESIPRDREPGLTRITRKLEDVRRDLSSLEEQGNVEGFFNNVKNADRLGGLVEDVRDAMLEYQVRIRSPSISGASEARIRPRCSKICMTIVVGSS